MQILICSTCFLQNSSEDFFSGDPFKSTSNTSSSSKDPFQSSDFFSGTDLFDGRPSNGTEDSSKLPEDDAFSSEKSDPFGSTPTKSSDDPFTASFANFPDASKPRHNKVA